MAELSQEQQALAFFKKARLMAYNLSSTDQIGAVLQKNVDLLGEMVKTDANPQKMRAAAISLENEWKLVQEVDKDRENSTRDLVYKFSERLVNTMRWYADREENRRNGAKVKKEEPIAADPDDLVDVSVVGIGEEMKEEDEEEEGSVKMEPMDNSDGEEDEKKEEEEDEKDEEEEEGDEEEEGEESEEGEPEEYVVEKIMDQRTNDDGEEEYLIKWEGYSMAENTWEPASSTNCPDKIAAFNKENKKEKKATPGRKRKMIQD